MSTTLDLTTTDPTTTAATLDLTALLILRDAHDTTDLVDRIATGDTEALHNAEGVLRIAQQLRRALTAKLAAMCDHTSPEAEHNARRATDALAVILDAVWSTDDLRSAIDNAPRRWAGTN